MVVAGDATCSRMRRIPPRSVRSQNGLVIWYRGAPARSEGDHAVPVSVGLRHARSVVAALFALGLGACAGVDEKTAVEGVVVTAPAKEVTTADFVKKNDYCPPIQIRAGTSSMTVYERGHENETQYVRYLASITQTARECTMVRRHADHQGRHRRPRRGGTEGLRGERHAADPGRGGEAVRRHGAALFRALQDAGHARRADLRRELQPGLRPGDRDRRAAGPRT